MILKIEIPIKHIPSIIKINGSIKGLVLESFSGSGAGVFKTVISAVADKTSPILEFEAFFVSLINVCFCGVEVGVILGVGLGVIVGVGFGVLNIKGVEVISGVGLEIISGAGVTTGSFKETAILFESPVVALRLLPLKRRKLSK